MDAPNFFRKQLLNWYEVDDRPMPWKGEQDPYRIWISEVILQQTRVAQGEAYYRRFIKRFPDVHALATATEDEVLKLWEGLGYYSRARNLRKAAQQVMDMHGGQLPDTYEALLTLKGIGPYTAAAIASFAFHRPHAVVDGNVLRVLARYFGVRQAINSTAGRKEINRLAALCLGDAPPAQYNQAILDFGASVCKPQQPYCTSCPLSDRCVALQEDLVAVLPLKEKTTAIQTRYFYYFQIESPAGYLIRRREDPGIWKGLYEFPLVTHNEYLHHAEEIQALAESAPWWSPQIEWQAGHSPVFKHMLTHRRILAVFLRGRIAHTMDVPGHQWVLPNQFRSFAFPKLIHRYLQDNSLTL